MSRTLAERLSRAADLIDKAHTELTNITLAVEARQMEVEEAGGTPSASLDSFDNDILQVLSHLSHFGSGLESLERSDRVARWDKELAGKYPK